jgi:hypothetical protein
VRLPVTATAICRRLGRRGRPPVVFIIRMTDQPMENLYVVRLGPNSWPALTMPSSRQNSFIGRRAPSTDYLAVQELSMHPRSFEVRLAHHHCALGWHLGPRLFCTEYTSSETSVFGRRW